MFITTAVTQKGQITIPKSMREVMGIKPYERVKISLADRHIRVEPLDDILELADKIKITNRDSVLKAREAFEKKYKRV